MKLSTLFLTALLSSSSVFAEPLEWWIDFGTAQYSYAGTRTTVAGWNNVAVGLVEKIDIVFNDGTVFRSKECKPQVSKDPAKLSNVYFADTISKDTWATEGTSQVWTVETAKGKFDTVYEVDIFDSKNSGNNLSLSITKDSKGGNLMTNETAQAKKAFAADDIADVPESAYADAIGCIAYDASSTDQKGGSNGAHQFTITLTGLNAGKYDITIFTATNRGAGAVYGGTVRPSVAVTLNDVSEYTVLGEGDMTGSGDAKYAGVGKWEGFAIDESGELKITVKGGCLVHPDCDSATCTEMHTCAYINALMISESLSVPEPTTATLSLLALCGLAARRRRC